MAPPYPSKEDNLADRSNFAYWRLTMKLWFEKKGLWEIVDEAKTKLEPLVNNNNNCWTRLMEDQFL